MKSLCWLRRDLRLHDPAALAAALAHGPTVLVFVFDTNILDKLEDKDDRRITFIMECLQDLEQKLQAKGSTLLIRYGRPEDEIPRLAVDLKVSAVFCNRDYEPYAKNRDSQVEKALKSRGIAFHQFKDSVVFEKSEVLNGAGAVFKVFTPYKNKWLETFEAQDKVIADYKCVLKNLIPLKEKKNVLDHDWYRDIGFVKNPSMFPGGEKAGLKRLKSFADSLDDYEEQRNFPALPGTSYLSVYIRFGAISVRDMLRLATSSRTSGAKTWLSEIIWRDFYQMILDAYPHVADQAYRPEYEKIRWLGKEEHFKAWCEGRTGFPIVDAAMRCLNQTGTMHNRLRMIVASFLCKILLVDYKKGEAYFARKLLDFDLAANNGGWQWSSSSGTDAQPYFRIFNPYTQSEKFDAEGTFIKKWCPELKDLGPKDIHRPDLPLMSHGYPEPIVEYEKNRERALLMYSVVKSKK